MDCAFVTNLVHGILGVFEDLELGFALHLEVLPIALVFVPTVSGWPCESRFGALQEICAILKTGINDPDVWHWFPIETSRGILRWLAATFPQMT